MNNAEQRHQALLARKYTDDLLTRYDAGKFHALAAHRQLELIGLLEEIEGNGGEAYVSDFQRAYIRATSVLPPGLALIDFKGKHGLLLAKVKQFSTKRGPRAWGGAQRRDDLLHMVTLLATLMRQADGRLTLATATKRATYRIAPHGLPTDKKFLTTRKRHRLTRKQREEWLRRLVEEDRGDYEGAARICLAYAWDCVNRDRGCENARGKDIIDGADGFPAFIKSTRGTGTKNRTDWRLGRFGQAFHIAPARYWHNELRRRHPDFKDGRLPPNAILRLDWVALRERRAKIPLQASTKKDFKQEWRVKLKLDFTPGPQSWRRFTQTRMMVQGYTPGRIKRAAGHTTNTRIRYELPDLDDHLEMATRTGYAQPDHTPFCNPCGLPQDLRATRCSHCQRALDEPSKLIAHDAYWQHEILGRFGQQLQDLERTLQQRWNRRHA